MDDGDEPDSSTKDWLKTISRGGLTQVNNMTFDVFLATEEELRKKIHDCGGRPVMDDRMKKEIMENVDVQFYWSMLSCEWEEESGNVLLEMIITQYLTIRGFSLASMWSEKFKQLSKRSTQKTKGVRKELIPPAASISDDSGKVVQPVDDHVD